MQTISQQHSQRCTANEHGGKTNQKNCWLFDGNQDSKETAWSWEILSIQNQHFEFRELKAVSPLPYHRNM